MSQLPLQIVPRRAYSARNYLKHSGVRSAFEQLLVFLSQPGFRIASVEGAPRVGLTHFSIALAQALSEKGQFPRLVEGADFFEWANERRQQQGEDPGEIVIVDDGDQYLGNIAANDGGHFVSIVESLRRSRSALVMLMHVPYSECGCDDHVLSRLRAGELIRIAGPADDDMVELIGQMANQRGINLSRRNQQYLAKRLPRDVSSIDDYLERAQQLAQLSGQGFKLPVLSDAIPSGNRR